MSLIALGMNGLLALLLLAALGFGIRLDRKLRNVRDGQQAFVEAVADINLATAKAQAGLADLRAATDEATDHLGGRIARARDAAERLEALLARAERLPAQAPAAGRDGPEGGLAALLASVADAAESITAPQPARPERPERTERLARSEPALRPSRIRHVADDDLFEDAGGRS